MKPAQLKAYKSLTRKKLRQSLDALSGAERKRKSAKIMRRLMETPVFRKAVNLLTYVALPKEVQTRELILKALALKKNVFVPRVDAKRRSIEIYRIRHWAKDLRRGAYGILEPKPARGCQGRVRELDLVVAPGLGFDAKGRRLGRGGGYFDRLLKKARRAEKIGVAFREQMIKNVPVGPNDISMDQVITD